MLTDKQKPTNLPDKPHDIPHPKPDSVSDKDPLDTTPKGKLPGSKLSDAEEGGVHWVEARHFALGEGADAEDAVEAAGAQPLQTGQGLPDLDAMGDQALE